MNTNAIDEVSVYDILRVISFCFQRDVKILLKNELQNSYLKKFIVLLIDNQNHNYFYKKNHKSIQKIIFSLQRNCYFDIIIENSITGAFEDIGNQKTFTYLK